jgi:hypothetical protein
MCGQEAPAVAVRLGVFFTTTIEVRRIKDQVGIILGNVEVVG